MSNGDFYQAALQEYESGNANDGLLAEAWVKANGDESRKKLEYVKLRVSQLKAAKMKRTAKATGALAFYWAKAFALLLVASVGIVLVSELTPRKNLAAPSSGQTPEIFGVVLAGVLLIYLGSKLLEWAFLKRIVENRALMVVLSTTVSLLLIFVLWYFGKHKPYAAPPGLLLSFLLASFLLVLARTFLPGNRH